MAEKKYRSKGLDASAIATDKKLANVLQLVEPFPYKRGWLDPNAMMENLKRFEGWSRCDSTCGENRPQGDSTRGENRPQGDSTRPWNIQFQSDLFETKCRICFQHRDQDYDDMDALGDYFTEEQRLMAQRKDANAPPLTEWASPKFRERAVRAVFAKNQPLTPRNLRDAFYELTKEATQFKPSLMVAVARYLFPNYSNPRPASEHAPGGSNPRPASEHAPGGSNGSESSNLRILDMSAGWGDRLLGAIALDAAEYRAFDPNAALQPGHDQIREMYLEPAQRENFTVTYTGFERAELPENHFDLMFSSPPFFDFEIYTRDPQLAAAQSVGQYAQLNDWLRSFLFRSMEAIWRSVRVGGFVVVHITDVARVRVCEPLCLFMQQLPGARFYGVLCSVGAAGKPRPLWVFQRTTRTDHERARQARREMVRLFPDLVDRSTNYDSTTGGGGTPPKSPSCGTLSKTPDAPDAPATQDPLNPPLIVESIPDTEFRIVRDDHLPGGTKQRAWRALANIEEDELVYAGPWNGFAQVALAVIGRHVGKRATAFVARDDYATSRQAIAEGATLKVRRNGTLKTLQTAATKYAEKNKAYLLAFGFDTPAIREAMTAAISQAAAAADFPTGAPYRFWLVSGSGMLVNVLAAVFPRAIFNVVQVGKTVWADQIPPGTTIHVAPENFYDDAEHQPPYASVPTYDAKVWRFMREHGQPGDIVWNVGASTPEGG